MADKVEFPHSGAEAEMVSHAPSSSASSRPSAMDDEPKAKGPASQLVVGLLMIVSLLVVSVIVGQREPKKAAAPAAPAAEATAAAPTTEPAPAPASEAMAGPAPGNAPADEFKEIKSQVDDLSAQIKGLQGKVDKLAKPEPAPDLKPIVGKVDHLAESIAAVTPLSEKVDKLDGRVGAVDDAMKSIKEEVSGLSEEVKKLTSAKNAAPADDAPTLSEGVELFKSGKYKEAGEVFKKVESANPNNARVFYYEALVNGLTTGDWKGDTLKIAAKGAALEKAGAPKPGDVDAAFSDLPASLKPWLAFFRHQAK